MTASEYNKLLNIARGIAWNGQEAEDLLQEALIAAIDAGRLDSDEDALSKWLAGVMRNKAKERARSDGRRKKRDLLHSEQQETWFEEEKHASDSSISSPSLDNLPPAARKVAILVLHGLNRKEICALLNLSSAAFRQRLTSIRKALSPLPAELQQEVLAMAYAGRAARDEQTSALPTGLIRRALLKHLNAHRDGKRTALGTHDPSGHLIIVSSNQIK